MAAIDRAKVGSNFIMMFEVVVDDGDGVLGNAPEQHLHNNIDRADEASNALDVLGLKHVVSSAHNHASLFIHDLVA